MNWAPLVGLIPVVIKQIKDLFDDDNKKQNNKYLEQKLSRQIEDLIYENKEKEKINKENQEKIKKLTEMMNNMMEGNKKKELEREKELAEKEQQRQKKEIEENQKKLKAIYEIKHSLNSQFTQSLFKALRNFSKEEEKWLNSLNEKMIQQQLTLLKKKLEVLFQKLYEFQKIEEKMNHKFIQILQNLCGKKEIDRMNYMLIGSSGVGKSTLINQLFGENLAEEGSGKRCTTEGKKYISNKLPFLSLYDSVGTEIGQGHTLEDVKNETLEEITKNLNINDPNEHIHCVIYCTTSNRIFEDELKIILKIREKYDGKKLPIVIAFTRAVDEEDVESKRKVINEFLNKYGESISDDFFGITFIKLHSKEKVVKRMGKVYCEPCFGLSDLISACYKKGEKSYKIAIKNSLIEIAKNQFYNYINNVSNLLVNEANFFSYLSKRFEPNFSDFISFTFEKITDIENQKGIEEYELIQLNKYINCNDKKNKINPTPNIIKNNNKDNLDLKEKTCIYCENVPRRPFKCENCDIYACEECYLSQFEFSESVKCLFCGKSESFFLYQEDVNDSNKNNDYNISESNNIDITNYNDNNDDDDDDDNFNILDNNNNDNNDNDETGKDTNNDYNERTLNILQNNLNLESKNSIYEYIQHYKEQMLEVVSKKFEEFTEKEVKNIYIEILEKYQENIYNKDIKLNAGFETKEQIIEKAKYEIKEQLKQPSEEKFLKRYASCLFQDIINIFHNEMKKKIDNFILNINNNEEINNFFNSNETLNDQGNLKIKEKFDEYIKSLQKKEFESQEKALKMEQGLDESQEMSVEYGKSQESQSYEINNY